MYISGQTPRNNAIFGIGRVAAALIRDEFTRTPSLNSEAFPAARDMSGAAEVSKERLPPRPRCRVRLGYGPAQSNSSNCPLC